MVTNYIYLASVILAGAVTTVMALNLWINRKIVEPDYSIFLLLSLWLWIAAQIVECVAVPLELKVVFYKIKFIGISLVSVFMLGFAVQHVRGKIPSLPRLLVFLAAPVVLCQLFTFFPALEYLAWKRFFISPNNIVLDIEAGPGYVAYNIYDVLLLALGYALLFIASVSPRAARKIRLLPFLLAGVLSSTAVLMDFLLKSQLFYYRFTPIALAISSLSVIYYLRLRYFRTIPLAQHALSQSMADGLIILSPENYIIYVNPCAQDLFDAPPTSLVGKPLTAFPGPLSTAVALVEEDGNRNRTVSLRGKTFDASLSPIMSRRRKVASKMFVLRDVTHLKQVEDSLRDLTNVLEEKVAERTRQLEEKNRELKEEVEVRKKTEAHFQASCAEKSVLLGELHHRVKNNLQIVSSLLRLQSHYIEDPKALELFEVSVSRIRSMALVHEKLYKSDDLAHTHFAQYLQELANSVLFSHTRIREHIGLELDIAPIELDIDKSILAGLIVNELIMNSLKHAFSDKATDGAGAAGNRIAISFSTDGPDYRLGYSDSGPGLPEGFRIEESQSLGMKIIQTLVGQLKGTMEVLPGAGYRVKIRFPIRSGG
jgi:two-component sensor histidine kinase/PAS domain-containing protein